jgi:hypothetical protein
MNKLTPFSEFNVNEGHSKLTPEDVKKILAPFDHKTKHIIVDLLCNNEEGTPEEMKEYLTKEVGLTPDQADSVLDTEEWFRLDYMDYCQKNGGDRELYEFESGTLFDPSRLKKHFGTPEGPKLPFKREFTNDEKKVLNKLYGKEHGYSKIDSRGFIVLNGGEEDRGRYYITEDDLKGLVEYFKEKHPQSFEAKSVPGDINTSRMNEYKNNFDVTKSPTSIAAKVEPLIGQMEKMNAEEIRKKFSEVVNDPKTHASDKVRAKWNQAIRFAKDKLSLMKTITNLYLAGARLAVNDSEKTKEMNHLTEFEKYNNK